VNCKRYKNIALTGMMGCGKSTVAKELKLILPNYQNIEMDVEIEKNEKISINEIFKKYGEPYFRTLETQLIKGLSNKQNLIISMGGGAFLNEENRNIFLEKAFCVYLKTSQNIIYQRVKNDKSRPLLNVDNLKEKIDNLISQREKYYKLAHIEIETDNKTPQEIAKKILEKYREYGN